MYCVHVSTRHRDPQLLDSIWGHYEHVLTSYSTLHNHVYLGCPASSAAVESGCSLVSVLHLQ